MSAGATIKAWIDDAVGRIVSAEVRAITRQAKHAARDRTRFNEWADFYFCGEKSHHRSYVAKVVVGMMKGTSDGSWSADDQAWEVGWVAAYSAAEWLTLHPDLPSLLEDWECIRTCQLTDLCIWEVTGQCTPVPESCVLSIRRKRR